MNTTPSPLAMRFTGKHACILGASSDIGIATAKLLEQVGMQLTLSACSLNGLAKLRDAFPTATILELNLEKLACGDTMEACVAPFSEAGATPDYLVDCMQSDFEAFIAGADAGAAARYLETNISGRAVCLRAIAREMLPQRFGRCIFVSSTAASAANMGQGFYAASKQAGEALYKSLGIELGRRGITTCSIRLGYVESGRGTTFIKNNPDVLKHVPTKRSITAEEAARTIAFLLSDDATMINSTTITMDGGLTACK